MRNESWTVSYIKKLSQYIVLDPILITEVISDEWRALQCEKIPTDWYQERNENGELKHKRIDFYWREIFSLKSSLGHIKYPELTRLIKCILVLSHGNADSERGFSQVSKFLLDSRTQLSAASISAIESTKDGLKSYGNKCHSVPITKEFLIKGRNAHKNYHMRLEEEKRIKEEKRRQREEKSTEKRSWKKRQPENVCCKKKNHKSNSPCK